MEINCSVRHSYEFCPQLPAGLYFYSATPMTLFKLSSASGWNYTFTPPLLWRYLNYPQLPAGIILLLRHSYDVI